MYKFQPIYLWGLWVIFPPINAHVYVTPRALNRVTLQFPLVLSYFHFTILFYFSPLCFPLIVRFILTFLRMKVTNRISCPYQRKTRCESFVAPRQDEVVSLATEHALEEREGRGGASPPPSTLTQTGSRIQI